MFSNTNNRKRKSNNRNDKSLNNKKGAEYSPLANLKRPYFKRSRLCPLAQFSNHEIDYKNPKLLNNFTSEGGRILPSRITSVEKRKQRLLSSAIKIARYLALLPYTNRN